MNAPQRIRLGDLLTQEGLLQPAQLTEALQIQKASGRRLGRIIVENGWVTEVQIAKTVARQLRVPYQELEAMSLRPELVRLLPEGQARRLRAVVLDASPELARVAMADPTDVAAFDEIGRLLKRELQLVAVAEGQLLQLIERSYTAGDNIAGLAKELTADITGVEDELGDLLGLKSAGAEDAPVVRLLQSVFEEALRLRASDIHIEPQERQLAHPLPHRRRAACADRGRRQDRRRSGAAPEADERPGHLRKRLPQDGRFNVKLKSGRSTCASRPCRRSSANRW
jgi:MSHA biogenesis protein MshE